GSAPTRCRRRWSSCSIPTSAARCAPACGRCCARGASPATARARAIPGRWCNVAGAYQPYLPATDMPRFLRELAEFVGLTDGDVAAIRRSAPEVLAREAALTAAFYEHFLKFPA